MSYFEKALVYDIETDGLEQDGRLLCVGYQLLPDGEPRCVQPERRGWMELCEMLQDPNLAKVEHSKFDAKWLRLHGIPVEGPVVDTMVMAWLCNENTPLTLEWLAKRYLHITMDKRIRTVAGEAMFKCDDGKVVPLGEAPIDQVMAYNLRDIHETTDLFLKLKQRMIDTEWWDYYVTEHLPFTTTLLDMECRGLPIDLPATKELTDELEPKSLEFGERLHREANLPDSFNLNSGPQLSAFLFAKVFELEDSLGVDEWTRDSLKECLAGGHEDCELGGDVSGFPDDDAGMPPSKDSKPGYGRHVTDLLPKGFTLDKVGRTLLHGRWTLRGRGLPGGLLTPSGDRFSSSSPALLTNLATATDEWCQTFLRYRKMTKVLTTYLRKWPVQEVDGRIFGRFNQTGTVTGRLSSSGPNLQNIPAHGELGPRIRNLFRAQPGTRLLVGDYSQLEPRLMAHFSQDPVLLDVYREGKDIYLTTAAGIWGEEVDKDDERRGIAKTYVLAMGYGAGVKKLQQILTINGYPLPINEVAWQYGKLTDLYGHFFSWREAVIAKARRTGYVQTIAGQHRRLAAQFKSDTWKARGYGERQAVNAVIQGSAGDIVRRAMMVTSRDFPELDLLAQVHDELVWEVDDENGVGPYGLDVLAKLAETGHGFDLSVPLVFEPHLGATWFEAKEGSAFVLPEDFAAPFEDEDAELEEADV